MWYRKTTPTSAGGIDFELWMKSKGIIDREHGLQGDLTQYQQSNIKNVPMWIIQIFS